MRIPSFHPCCLTFGADNADAVGLLRYDRVFQSRPSPTAALIWQGLACSSAKTGSDTWKPVSIERSSISTGGGGFIVMQALSGPPTVVGSCPCLVSSRIPYRVRRDIVLEKGPIGALYFFGGFTPLRNALAGSCCPRLFLLFGRH